MTPAIDINTALAKSLLRTLIYFDVFKHPLTAIELMEYCDLPNIDQTQVNTTLGQLLADELIFCHHDFYSISKQANRGVRRLDANQRATSYLRWAFRLSKLIGAFPFVRAVMISGSLSKKCAYKDSDIDYVIVTTANRIWLVRGILRSLVKLLLLQRFKKLFCLNYFLDEEHLNLDLKNHYIASEMAFLIPTYGGEVYQELWKKNEWVRQFYPNFPEADISKIPSAKPSLLKQLGEKLMNNRLSDAFSQRYQKFSNRNWEKKRDQQKISHSALLEGEEGEIKSFSFTPEAFMNVFQQRIEQFETKHEISLN